MSWFAEADALKGKGNEAFMAGNVKKAIDHYSDALQKFPPSDSLDAAAKKLGVALRSNRAQCHLNLGKAGKARQDAEAAIAFDPDHVKSYYRLAAALQDLHETEKALDICEKGLAIDDINESLIELFGKLKELSAKNKQDIAAQRGDNDGDGNEAAGHSGVLLPILNMRQVLPADMDAVKHIKDDEEEEEDEKKPRSRYEYTAKQKADHRKQWEEEQLIGCPRSVEHDWVNGGDCAGVEKEFDLRVDIPPVEKLEEYAAQNHFSDQLHVLNNKAIEALERADPMATKTIAKKGTAAAQALASAENGNSDESFAEAVRACVFGWDARSDSTIPASNDFQKRTALMRSALNDYPVWVYFGDRVKTKEGETELPHPVYLNKSGPFAGDANDQMSYVNRCDVFRKMYFMANRTKHVRSTLDDVRTLYRWLRDYGTARLPQKLSGPVVDMDSTKIEEQLLTEFCDVNADCIKRARTIMRSNPKNRLPNAVWRPNDFLLRQKEVLDKVKDGKTPNTVYVLRKNVGGLWEETPLEIADIALRAAAARSFKAGFVAGNKKAVAKLYAILKEHGNVTNPSETLVKQLAVEFDMNVDDVLKPKMELGIHGRRPDFEVVEHPSVADTKHAEQLHARGFYPGNPKWINNVSDFHAILAQEWHATLRVAEKIRAPTKHEVETAAANLKSILQVTKQDECQTCEAKFAKLPTGPQYPVQGDANTTAHASYLPPLPSKEHATAGAWSTIADGVPQSQDGTAFCTNDCHRVAWNADHQSECEELGAKHGAAGAYAMTKYFWNLVIMGAIPHPGAVDWVAAWEVEKNKRFKNSNKKALIQEELSFYLQYERAAITDAIYAKQEKVKLDPTNEQALHELFDVLATQFTRMTNPLLSDSPARLRFKLVMVNAIGVIVQRLITQAMDAKVPPAEQKTLRQHELDKAVFLRQAKRYCDAVHASNMLTNALKVMDKRHNVKVAELPAIAPQQVLLMQQKKPAPGGPQHQDPNKAAGATVVMAGGELMMPGEVRQFFRSA